MAMMRVPTKAREASIRAVVTRADGTVEDLGVVSYWHKSWWRRVLWRMRSRVWSTR